MTTVPCPFARIVVLVCLAWHIGTTWVRAAGKVEAELRIPPAETHVLGDPTPLFWRFRNISTEPLAFMWEGCCRLNGRLTVTAVDRPITMVPPGQALAHMFAKAERLDPGVARDFDTFLSDWTRLTSSGTYELRGRYTGVLNDQHPQVPKGLGLWRDAAETPPVQVTLTSIEDYLAQRAERSARRGLEPTLLGADLRLLAASAAITLRIRNSSSAPQPLAWPDGLELWLVDPSGQRVRGAQSNLEGTFEEVLIAPGDTFERVIPLRPELLEGEPFGDYLVFIDVRSIRPDQARVPSNTLPLSYTLTPAQVAEFLARAAAGPAQGLRNAPLKLLRVYLSEIRSSLDAIPTNSLPPAALTLLTQLRLAACAKPFAPRPGRVEIPFEVRREGILRFRDSSLAGCFDLLPTSVAERFKALLGVRRHLGWEIGVRLHPAPDALMSDVAAGLKQFDGLREELSGAIRLPLVDTTNLLAVSITCPSSLPPADLAIRLATGNRGIALGVARAKVTSLQGGGKIAPAEMGGVTFDPAPTLEGLGLPREPRTAQIVVLCDAELAWSSVLEALAPLSKMPVLIALGVGSGITQPR